MTIITAPPVLLGRRGLDLTGVECRILRASLGLERRHVARFIETLDLAPGGIDTTFERINAWIARLTAWEKAKGRGYPGALVIALTAIEHAVEAWARQAAAEAGGEGEAVLYRPLGARHAFALLELDRYGLRLTPDQIAALDNPNGEIWLALADAAIARAALYLRFWPIGGPRSVTRVELDREPDGPIRPNPVRQSAPPRPLGPVERTVGALRDAGPELAKVMGEILAGREEPWVARLRQAASETIGQEAAARWVEAAARLMPGVSNADRAVVAQRLGQGLASGRFTADELFSIGERAPLLVRAIVLEMNGGAPGTVKIDKRAVIPAGVVTQALLRPHPAA